MVTIVATCLFRVKPNSPKNKVLDLIKCKAEPRDCWGFLLHIWTRVFQLYNMHPQHIPCKQLIAFNWIENELIEMIRTMCKYIWIWWTSDSK